MGEGTFRHEVIVRINELKKNRIIFTIFVSGVMCVLCAFLLLITGMLLSDFSIMMVGTLCMFCGSILFCVQKLKSRFLLLVFNLMIFVFLMCRPLIDIVKRELRWDWYYQASVSFAILSVAVSLLALCIGSQIYELLIKKNVKEKAQELFLAPKGHNTFEFRVVSLSMFFVCLLFFVVKEADKLAFMQGKTYTDFYLYYMPDYPSYVGTIAAMMPYAMCMYLATLPGKRCSLLVLALYILSAVPQLIIGIRNPLVLNILFSILYCILRDIHEEEDKWIGKKEIMCCVIIAPIALVALSAYNYLRAGDSVKGFGIFSLILDLFYKQGVSFDVLCMAHNAIPELPGGSKCYTLGPFIEAILYGRIGQFVFGTEPLPSGNNAIRAIEGYSFAHSMSYVAHPHYLEGSGWGSSYILETYADAGWFGLILFSVCLGALLVCFSRSFKSNWSTRVFILTSLAGIFFIPRAEALGWAQYIITIHFWFALFACICGSLFLKKTGLVGWIYQHVALICSKKRKP